MLTRQSKRTFSDFLSLRSWQDGNPEYLSDLDRQVMQKQRLKQVKFQNPRYYLCINSDILCSSCLAIEKLRVAEATLPILIAIGEDLELAHRNKTKTSSN